MNVSNLTLERVPPQNLDAEMALLGSMIIDEDAISQAVEIVNKGAFYKEAHKIVFDAMVELYTDGNPVDLVTLIELLKKKKLLEKTGGASFLTSLTTAVPTAANVSHYAKIVKEKSVLRSLINISTQIVSECYDAKEDVDGLLDRAEKMIFDISSRKIKSDFVQVKDIIKDSIEAIDNLYQRKTYVTGIPTGFVKFDTMTAGLQPSDLIIVAGRPSMGKSAFACSILEHVGIIEKKPVAMFSLEMSNEQMVQRILCSHAKVDAHKVRTGFLSQSDWPKLTNTAGKLSEAPIFIDDTPAITVLELRAKARRLKARHDIQLIVVDYIQLMRGLSSENRQQEISEISRSLKALAREINVPVIGISQLSRAVENRQGNRPQLSDLRESGAIEQDADVVVLLFREEYYRPTPENKGVAEAIIGKQRNGPVGTVRLAFIKEYTRFDNLSYRDDMGGDVVVDEDIVDDTQI